MSNTGTQITWNLIFLIVLGCIGLFESGRVLGGAMAIILYILVGFVALIGLIPFFIGPVLYYLYAWPWISNAILSAYPAINMPFTVMLILIGSIINAIIYTLMTTIGIAYAVDN
jgi:hypothetical protein